MADMTSQMILVSCFALICCNIAGLARASNCYSCDRFSVTNYNGASESEIEDAIAQVLSIASVDNVEECADGSLTESEKKTCGDDEACYVLTSTFTIEHGTDTLDAEGEIHYCLTSTERLPELSFGCVDESDAEFAEAAANSIGLLASPGSPFSNPGSYDGQLCKCTTDYCNGSPQTAAANSDGDDDNDDADDDDADRSSFLQPYTFVTLIMAVFVMMRHA